MDAVARVWWSAVGDGAPVARHASAWWERVVAAREHRAPETLVHAMLEVVVDGDAWVVEMAPTWGRGSATPRRAVGVGPVGSALLARCSVFRYEVRVAPGGMDRGAAVAVGEELRTTGDLLGGLADLPLRTWGRDEARVGDMWTSNSVVAWLLVRGGLDPPGPPPGLRAPGWAAGLAAAREDGSAPRRGRR